MSESSNYQIEELAVSLGEKLRQKRLALSLSLEQASADLKIMTKHLTALEAGSVAKLPSLIAGRGFLKNYARYLKLNIKEVLAEFDALAEKMSPKKIYPGGNLPSPNRFNYFVYAGVVLLVIVIASAWLRRNPTPPPLARELAKESAAIGFLPDDQPLANKQEAPDQAKNQTVTISPPPAKNQPGTTSTASATISGHSFVLEITEKCWLDVVADGKEVFQETLQAGEKQTWTIKHSLYLKAGNAGGLKIYQDGRSLPPLGGRGEVIKKEFTF